MASQCSDGWTVNRNVVASCIERTGYTFRACFHQHYICVKMTN